VAQQVGVDRRTVHRRLARHGTTYSALLDEVRRDMAPRYLDNSVNAP
jgi:AraC-like DNA-binding protein